LTSSQINLIAFAVRDGGAEPEDARRLMQHFCELVDRGRQVPPQLLQHFRQSFSAYLDGTKKLEAALGVVRKRGRPQADENLRREIAAEILRQRLVGKSHEQALMHTATQFGWSETIISEAWKNYKFSAIDLILIERANRHPKFSVSEQKRLANIYPNMPRIDSSGKIAE
jgi:hypothetical protein